MLCNVSFCFLLLCLCFFFFKQKTAYEMRISDWSSDVCSSDLSHGRRSGVEGSFCARRRHSRRHRPGTIWRNQPRHSRASEDDQLFNSLWHFALGPRSPAGNRAKSEEHTSELPSLMRTSYAVFCLKTKKQTHTTIRSTIQLY